MTHGPQNADETARFLREVMGVTPEDEARMVQLAIKRKAEEAAHPERQRQGKNHPGSRQPECEQGVHDSEQ